MELFTSIRTPGCWSYIGILSEATFSWIMNIKVERIHYKKSGWYMVSLVDINPLVTIIIIVKLVQNIDMYHYMTF